MHDVNRPKRDFWRCVMTCPRSLTLLLVEWIACVLPSNTLVGASVRDAFGSGALAFACQKYVL
jgi:hypothetical protein